LLLLLAPLVYSIARQLLNPFGYVPRLKEMEQEPQFQSKLAIFKRENRYKFVTCWFVLKVSMMLV
jgi:hypothetical protein